MSTAVLDGDAATQRIEVISAQARQVHIGRVLLTAAAAVLLGIGRAAGGLVNAVVWSCVAIREGYRDARSPRRPVGGDG